MTASIFFLHVNVEIFLPKLKETSQNKYYSRIYDWPNIFLFLLRSDLEKGNLIKFKIEKNKFKKLY